MRRLEIGSGNSPQNGFEHLEINPDCPHIEYNCDCREIPVADNTFDEILAVHVIEHMEWQQGIVALKEWSRVLKPGGMLCISTPNLDYIINSYLDDSDKNWKRELKTPGWSFPEPCHHDKTAWLNFKIFSTDIPFNLHKACYDAKWMTKLLNEAGFDKVEIIQDPSSLNVRAYKANGV